MMLMIVLLEAANNKSEAGAGRLQGLAYENRNKRGRWVGSDEHGEQAIIDAISTLCTFVLL